MLQLGNMKITMYIEYTHIYDHGEKNRHNTYHIHCNNDSCILVRYLKSF